MPAAQPSIVVVGLGPGDLRLLTMEAWQTLSDAPIVYLRTAVHPTVPQLRERLGDRFRSFDDVYERAESFDEVYQTISARLMEMADQATQPIVYAVPGHPLVAERVTTLLLESAPARGMTVRVVDGLSFVEPVLTALGTDLLSVGQGSGLSLLDALALQGNPGGWNGETIDAEGGRGRPLPRLVDTGRPLLIPQLYSVVVASGVKLWLLERYPADHPCTMIRAVDSPHMPTKLTVPLAEIDRHVEAIDHLTTLYVPALAPLHDLRSPLTVAAIVARLRATNGCPWDREQTHESIKPQLIEECYEVLQAIDNDDVDNLAEELGDVLLHVAMHAQFAEESGAFDLGDVAETINAKLIRRHPHVFGDVEAETASQVLHNWEEIKRAEKSARREHGDDIPAPSSALGDIPLALPALARAQKVGRKAASSGVDWTQSSAVYDKIAEEINELKGAATTETQHDEMGDLLFTVVNLCRYLHIDAEDALRGATAKFQARFQAVERLAHERDLTLSRLSAGQIDLLWNEARALIG